VAKEIATKLTSGAKDPYTKARLLQDYFHGNGFQYDLHVPRGHSTNAIEEFLRDKRGYCEQYAGTYAAMARAIGLPSRVAVGFTPGDANGTTYTVRASTPTRGPRSTWASTGGVAFEPTPNRGAPLPRPTPACPSSRKPAGPATGRDHEPQLHRGAVHGDQPRAVAGGHGTGRDRRRGHPADGRRDGTPRHGRFGCCPTWRGSPGW